MQASCDACLPTVDQLEAKWPKMAYVKQQLLILESLLPWQKVRPTPACGRMDVGRNSAEHCSAEDVSERMPSHCTIKVDIWGVALLCRVRACMTCAGWRLVDL